MAKSQISDLKVAISSLLLGAYGRLKIGFLSWPKYMCVRSLNEIRERVITHTSQTYSGGGAMDAKPIYPYLLFGDINKYVILKPHLNNAIVSSSN